ncbi:MAG: methylated-DNA--[protein]-cysteine S-methyltransferase [Chloroflexi bacterium]|nr:methylated-DNA--[protein]-cysteine S-methyltransferase [Chloroflexota bacterium]
MAVAYYGIAETEFGPMLVAGEGRRLAAIKFGVDARRMPEAVEALSRELHGTYGLVADERRVKPLIKQLNEYLAGKRTAFDVELDLSWMTPFRRRVMEECAKVPRGQVATYADLARRAGSPTAYRAVGRTMATNPVPIVVPCHRIVGSGGGLHGFGGGLDMKARLLALEGARLA